MSEHELNRLADMTDEELEQRTKEETTKTTERQDNTVPPADQLDISGQKISPPPKLNE